MLDIDIELFRSREEEIGVGLGIGNVAEEPLRLLDFVRITQRFHHDPAPARLEADELFAPAHR